MRFHAKSRAAGAVCALTVWASAIATASAAENRSVWREDFEAARQEAQRLDRPLLLHFHAEWCAPCDRMERQVLQTAALAERIQAGFVAVKVDSDRHPELVRRYDVQALPSDVVVAPAGHVLARSEGFQDISTYLGRLASAAARLDRERKVRIARNGTGGGDSTGDHVDRSSAPADHPTAPDARGGDSPRVLGLDGYSPVALAKSRTWVRGLEEYAAEHKGITYRMSTAEELTEFRSDPERYVPRLLGCDPVVLWRSDRAVAGTTRFGAFFDGELFLFVSQDSRDEFKKSPYRFTRTRHVLRVDEIEGTRLR